MNSPTIIRSLAAASLLALAGGWILLANRTKPALDPDGATRSDRRSAATHSTPGPARDLPGSRRGDGNAPILSASSHEEIERELNEASTRYDESSVRAITPYLSHPNPDIRQAALNAMIVAGQASGVLPLRVAAKRLADPRETIAYQEAADFLELPSHNPVNPK